MFRLVVLTCLVALARSAALTPKANEDQRIVGGFPIDISTIPFQVSLQDDDGYLCGGTLIAPTIVITAAHCTSEKDNYELAVRVGSNLHYDGGEVIPVIAIMEHPNFNDVIRDYDIAILILAWAQTYTTQFPTLPSMTDTVEDGALALVSGWGVTMDSQESTDILRAVFVPIFNHDKCSVLYEEFGGATEQMLCAGDPVDGGFDTCEGDSGGPLILDGVLIGVVAWDVHCGAVGLPGVYTLVSSVRAWIMQQINM